MVKNITLLTTFGLLLGFIGSKAQAQTITTVGCGTEGGTICIGGSSGNPEYYANNVDGTGQPCDYGLKISGTICVNDVRHVFADYRGDPVGKVLHDQLYSAQADQPVNRAVFLGTHNSFSSYRSDVRLLGRVPSGVPIADPVGVFSVGITPSLLADQLLSISDQLTSGASFLVLHPHFYLGQMRVCHENFSDSLESLICGDDTYGRLLSYAVQEIATWLDNNPGEFVVLRLYHDVGASNTALLAQILNSYLGSKIYKPDYTTWQSSGFPSLRTLRARGNQIMIIGAESDDPGKSIDQVMWDWGTVVMDDGYSDSTNWGSCRNSADSSVISRPSNQFAFVAEDRSGSNALDAYELSIESIGGYVKQLWDVIVGTPTNTYNPGGVGLLGPNEVGRAVTCTYSLIGLDFWAAGSAAYDGSPAPPLTPTYNYSLPNPDPRQARAAWTFQADNSTASFTAAMPVSTDTLSGWHPDIATTSLPFLCADLGSQNGLPPDRKSGTGQNWTNKLTSSTGAWTDGEATCQKEFGTSWHFWAPETPREEALLGSTVVNLVNPKPFWLNMKITPPNVRPPLVVTPSLVTIAWTKGQAVPAMPYIFTKGGAGGALTLTAAISTGSTQTFVEVSDNGSSPAAKLNSAALNQLTVGTHYNNILITETDPAYGALTFTLPVQLQVSAVISKCDVNADGNTNVSDVQVMINEALGATSSTNDLNHDGGVNVSDVQIVINAALGGVCSAT